MGEPIAFRAMQADHRVAAVGIGCSSLWPCSDGGGSRPFQSIHSGQCEILFLFDFQLVGPLVIGWKIARSVAVLV
jgi:hypothetical protein